MSELKPHYIVFTGDSKVGAQKYPDLESALMRCEQMCEKSPATYWIYQLVGVVDLAPEPVRTRLIERAQPCESDSS